MQKKLFVFICLLLFVVNTISAQMSRASMLKTTTNMNRAEVAAVKIVPDWSGYMETPDLPGLKVRERHYIIGNTQKLDMEVISAKHATGNFTASTCNENRTINGWQTITLLPNTPQVLHFETTDACNNGWWWQVANFNILTNWSDWTVDQGTQIKARMRYNFTTQGVKFIQVELQAPQTCRFLFATKVCQADDVALNGWRPVQLQQEEAKVYNFDLRNTCQDGWWWQIKNYYKNSPGFGNDLELNPTD
ncbi:hypothetical protein C7N43_13245 [Sphingobacteriales bacterium UPWRP_1]|nr:hypothetical protein BVG80_14755 [Sphingobacteriales bacterium TSM_CSM]PSJ76571.1 hypothetical protein C7N43_13245 [Sphingobacteriales bacterium UPWRP_1]